ncbi:hypothetical protein ACQ4PT_072282 [Festuca glaucescens]
MEATAVSLTRTVLDGVLGSAGTAMVDEAALLLGVRREVDFIRSELQMMQSFLRVQSSAGAACKDTVKTCVKQVRDLACDLEDCLLDFTLHASRARWLRWGPGIVARHRVAGRIRELKASVVELNQRNQRYNVFVADKDPPAASDEHGHADDGYHQLAYGEQHQDIERLNEMGDLAKLVTKDGARVVSVWGMGGMGKSSLVRMLYNNNDLIDGFDCRAWVTVPHPLDSADELEQRLRKQLGMKPADDLGVPAWMEEKSCLVVVDDVATREEWELISQRLGTGSRSRVVVTTRREDVARRCVRDVLQHVYELRPLEVEGEEARKLLYRKRLGGENKDRQGEFSVTTPERIEKLRNLQVLGVVRIAQGSEAARNLGKLTSLRRLGVDVAASQEVWMDLCRSIASLVRLERLEVRSESLEFLKDTKESPPKHLTSLRLCGRLGKLPEWMGSLNDLGKVKLLRTQLKQIDIEVIGNLPNLTLLALWEESFAEGSLCFSEGTFQKLKLLYIEGSENIETIKIEEGTLPVLEKLEVKKCISLHDSELGLSRVKFLENLNELVLTSCGDKPQLEKALQRQISGFELAKRPKLITGKSIVTRS